jgi:hypothetical protein
MTIEEFQNVEWEMAQQFSFGLIFGMIICYKTSSQGFTPMLRTRTSQLLSFSLKIRLQINSTFPCLPKPIRNISNFRALSNSYKFRKTTKMYGNIYGEANNTQHQSSIILHLSLCNHHSPLSGYGIQDAPTNLESSHGC